jgi:flagellar biosynthesis protein FlhG
MSNQPTDAGRNKPRIISVTGGKGGVGKTTIAVNLAVAFAKLKKKVLLFDADLGLANVDLMFNIKPQKTIHDFVSGQCELSETCVKGPHGISIIPAASGIQKLADLSSSESVELIKAFSSLTNEFDIMLVDLAAGISSQVMNFTHASQDILVVICNDPASLMDSYAVIKILHQQYSRNRFGVVVNKVKTADEGVGVFARFQAITSKFMNISMHYLGHVPQDDYIHIAALDGVPAVDRFPNSQAVVSLKHISNNVLNWHDADVSGGIQFFFERLVYV